MIVRWACPQPSHHSSEASLDEYLRRWRVPAITEIDTRALTRHLRINGTQRAVLTHEADAPSQSRLTELAMASRRVTPLSEQDLVAETSRTSQVEWFDPLPAELRPRLLTDGAGLLIAVVDYGVKSNILRSLRERGCRVIVLPHTADWSDIEASGADGLVLSNGPGDPAVLAGPVELARQALGRLPLFGICLGHQILGMAAGATTSRLPFGHHGANHPVKDLETGLVHITSQNHEFQVDAASIPVGDLAVTQRNLHDGSVEGLAHRRLPAFSVQYHPEGCPGPQDNQHLYDRFVQMVGLWAQPTKQVGRPLLRAVGGAAQQLPLALARRLLAEAGVDDEDTVRALRHPDEIVERRCVLMRVAIDEVLRRRALGMMGVAHGVEIERLDLVRHARASRLGWPFRPWPSYHHHTRHRPSQEKPRRRRRLSGRQRLSSHCCRSYKLGDKSRREMQWPTAPQESCWDRRLAYGPI